MTRFVPAPFVGLLLLGMAGCDRSPQPLSREPAPLPPVDRRVDSRELAGHSSLKSRQLAFLNRIRESDPQQQTIDRALLNERNELGLILDRRVEMDQIPALLKAMLTQMAKEFPNEDLTVVAYAPSEPPRKIGTGYLDARTREMRYTPER